jgi:hypothetical protein
MLAESPQDFTTDVPIFADRSISAMGFRFQDGPISEVGKNGAQFTVLIETALIILKTLNDEYPCRENHLTITKLEEALMWQEKRTKDRIDRNVEGFNKL